MLHKLKDLIRNSPPVTFLINISKKIVLPGFDGLPLYDVATFFIQGIHKGLITTRAASLAFRFFLALFPFVLFLFTLIPYLPIKDFHEQLLMQLSGILPTEAFNLVRETIDDLVSRPREGLLSVGFILAMYFSTNGISAMITAFNQSYFTIEKRNFFKQRLVAIALILILTVLLFMAVSLIIFGKMLLTYLVSNDIITNTATLYIFQISKWLIIVTMFYLSISFLYFMGPSRKTKWRFRSAGSTLATILIIVVCLAFAYFVNHFGNYNKLYGSIGSLIVIMLWIYFNCIIILIGFELNASIHNAKQEKLLGEG